VGTVGRWVMRKGYVRRKQTRENPARDLGEDTAGGRRVGVHRGEPARPKKKIPRGKICVGGGGVVK